MENYNLTQTGEEVQRILNSVQTIDNSVTQNSSHPVTGGAVFSYLNSALSNTVAESGVYDVTVNNNNAKFASLSALLNSENLDTLIPIARRKGGMSIKFVHTYDNKYVQYRLMSDGWSTTESDWQGVDDEPTVGSQNLVKSGGVLQSEYDLVGIVAKTVKPDSGWYGSITGRRFNIVANKQYAIYNVGNSKAVSIRLYNANNEVVETKDVNVEVGANSIVSFAHNAVYIDIFFNGNSNELDFYEVDSYRAEIDKLQQGLIQTANNVGFISKVVKPSSGWYGSETGHIFNIVSGTEYYLSNTGESTAISIRLFNESDEVVETKDVNIAAGASSKVTFSHDAVRIDIFFAGSNNVLGFYIADSVGGELQDTKTKIPTLSDNLGDSDKIVPTQRLLKSQSNSIFEDYRTSGTGIVGFGVKEDFSDLSTVKKFRFNTYSFYNNVLYGDIQGLIGDEWTNLDSINHTKGDDNIEIVESVYHRFFVIANYPILYPTGSIYRNLDWQIRNSAVQFVTKEIFAKLNDLLGYVAIPSYELKDSSVVNISVKKDGTGDFATIGDAIASIGSATQRNESSSFEKQYCIRVFPGVYNEVNLFVPDYVHIYGLHPNTVIVTSVGLTPEGNPPVFDMYGNSKLSNMTIISAFGYCVHVDSGRGSRTCVCENLYCKKVYNATSQNPQGDDVRNNAWTPFTNPSVIGMGMGINEYKFIFKNCTFENGWVAAHTNANNDSTPNTRIEYHNCKLVNAIIDLQTLDNSGGQYHTDGKYICVVDNLKTQRGRVSLRLDFFENNSAWSVLGGCNDNFVPSFNNLDGASESWENLNTTEKSFVQLASGVSCTKGQFIDCDGNICTGSTPKDDIVGIALDAMSADSLDAVSVWIGNAFLVTLTAGEYGIGADGKLSASATNKIGYIKNNIFYRY